MKNYKQININQLVRFKIIKKRDKYLLRMPYCSNYIIIKLPFILDENIAKLAGLMPDGSLIKDIRRLYFSQKKDFSKHILFQKVIHKLFSPNNKIFMKNTSNCPDSYINSTVLCHFLHYLVDFKKSDEEMRVPEWLYTSPDSVKRAYLHEAFAMEGTIFKSLTEIRFYSKFEQYCLDIQRLLVKLNIKSFVKSRVAGTPPDIQYRLSIYRKENFQEFLKIGVSIPLHVERFALICKKYGIKSKAF